MKLLGERSCRVQLLNEDLASAVPSQGCRERLDCAPSLPRVALAKSGADADVISDIEVAVSETCTNVLHHSKGLDEYEVRLEIDDQICEVAVVDVDGGHFLPDLSLHGPADVDADGGRGIHLMQSLMEVRFTVDPERGGVVHLVKALR